MEFSPIKWKNMRSTAGFLPCIEKPKILQDASLGEIYLKLKYYWVSLAYYDYSMSVVSGNC
jgi:hypothetical protein